MKRILFLTNNNETTYSSYFLSYEARIGIIYPEPYRTYFNTFFTSLESSGIITQLDVLRVYANISRDAAQTNMISANFKATEVGSPAFVQYAGYTFGIGQYLNSNFNPNTQGVNYTKNNASASYRKNTNISGAYSSFGAVTNPVGYLSSYSKSGTSSFNWINTNGRPGNGASFTNSTANGFYQINRVNSTDTTVYKDSILKVTSNTYSANSLPITNLIEGAYNVASEFDENQLSVMAFGSANVDPTNFFTIVSTLLTSLGI